jgi:lipoprotein
LGLNRQHQPNLIIAAVALGSCVNALKDML